MKNTSSVLALLTMMLAAAAWADEPNGRAVPGAEANRQHDPYYGQDYGYPGRAELVATIEHSYPEQVYATIGAVGDPFAPMQRRFDADGYEIIRQRQEGGDERRDDQGRHRGDERRQPRDDRWERRANRGSLSIDVGRYGNWMDGRREWYLRLDDRSGRGGRLLGFSIRTDRGQFQVRNVPAWFGPNRPIEARVLPQLSNGYGGTYDPYPSPSPSPYPAPYPPDYGYSGTVIRTLPRQSYSGDRMTIQYRVQVPRDRPYSRVEVTEIFPPEAYRLVTAVPQPRYADLGRRQVIWDLGSVRDGQALWLEVVVPGLRGWQAFQGRFSFDGGPAQPIRGDERFWVGDNYPGSYQSGGGYYQDPLGNLLGQILGGTGPIRGTGE